jgi:hypothetical protein
MTPIINVIAPNTYFYFAEIYFLFHKHSETLCCKRHTATWLFRITGLNGYGRDFPDNRKAIAKVRQITQTEYTPVIA